MKYLPKLFPLILAFQLLFLGVASSQGRAAPPAVQISKAQLDQLQARFPRLEADRVFFHWCDVEGGFRWSLQKRLEQGEVDFFNTPTSRFQTYGPGIYLAGDKKSSESFGDYPVTATISKGTLIYDATVAKVVLGHDATNEEMLEIGKRLPMIRRVSEEKDWWLTNHTEPLSRLTYGGKHGAQLKGGREATRFHEMFKELERRNPADGYATSLKHLIHFMDGVSFARAIRVNPGNPWSEFDPENFERFKAAESEIFDGVQRGVQFGYSEGSLWGDPGSSPESWAQKQVNESIPKLWSKLSGTQAVFRGDGIRAGGDRQGQTFFATPTQYEAIRANVYLDDTAVKDPTSSGYFVSYKYPDVFNFKRLRDRISPELYQRLSSEQENLKTDAGLRAELNRRLMKELMIDLFKRWHGKPVASAQFIQEIISIHPFSNMNGRTMRLYQASAMLEAGQSLYYHMVSDFDLLFGAAPYQRLLNASRATGVEMIGLILAETIEARAQGRTPDYQKLDLGQVALKALDPVGVRYDVRLSHANYEQIRTRDWHVLFSDISGSHWDLQDPELLSRAVIQAHKDPLASAQVRGELNRLLLRNANQYLKNSDLETHELLVEVFGPRLNEYPEALRSRLLQGLSQAATAQPNSLSIAMLLHLPNLIKTQELEATYIAVASKGSFAGATFKAFMNHQAQTRPDRGLSTLLQIVRHESGARWVIDYVTTESAWQATPDGWSIIRAAASNGHLMTLMQLRQILNSKAWQDDSTAYFEVIEKLMSSEVGNGLGLDFLFTTEKIYKSAKTQALLSKLIVHGSTMNRVSITESLCLDAVDGSPLSRSLIQRLLAAGDVDSELLAGPLNDVRFSRGAEAEAQVRTILQRAKANGTFQNSAQGVLASPLWNKRPIALDALSGLLDLSTLEGDMAVGRGLMDASWAKSREGAAAARRVLQRSPRAILPLLAIGAWWETPICEEILSRVQRTPEMELLIASQFTSTRKDLAMHPKGKESFLRIADWLMSPEAVANFAEIATTLGPWVLDEQAPEILRELLNRPKYRPLVANAFIQIQDSALAGHPEAGNILLILKDSGVMTEADLKRIAASPDFEENPVLKAMIGDSADPIEALVSLRARGENLADPLRSANPVIRTAATHAVLALRTYETSTPLNSRFTRGIRDTFHASRDARAHVIECINANILGRMGL